MSKRTKESTKKLNSLLLIILLTAILMIASTYAWFSTQKDVTLSNLQGTVKVAEGLEGSIDGKTWGNSISLSDLKSKQTELNNYRANSTIFPDELLPASASGQSGTVMNLWRGDLKNHERLEEIVKTVEANYANGLTEKATPSYIAFDLFLKDATRTEGPEEPGTILQLNNNSTMIAGETNSGLQNAMRVGFATYGTGADVLADQTALKTFNFGDVTDIAIWEPNADSHIPYIVNNNKLVGQSITAPTGAPIKTYAVDDDNAGGPIAQIFTPEGGKNIEQHALQTNATFGDYAKNLKSATDGSKDFKILSNKISRLRIYFWLEGSDVDCANVASQGKTITTEIGLIKDAPTGARQ